MNKYIGRINLSRENKRGRGKKKGNNNRKADRRIQKVTTMGLEEEMNKNQKKNKQNKTEGQGQFERFQDTEACRDIKL